MTSERPRRKRAPPAHLASSSDEESPAPAFGRSSRPSRRSRSVSLGPETPASAGEGASSKAGPSRKRARTSTGSLPGDVMGIVQVSEAFNFYLQLVDHLIALPEAEGFRRPVQDLWDESAIPGYTETIKNPMDLGTVKKNLKESRKFIRNGRHGPYLDEDAVLADIRLVFNNCMEYNSEESEFYGFAELLLKRASDKVAPRMEERKELERRKREEELERKRQKERERRARQKAEREEQQRLENEALKKREVESKNKKHEEVEMERLRERKRQQDAERRVANEVKKQREKELKAQLEKVRRLKKAEERRLAEKEKRIAMEKALKVSKAIIAAAEREKESDFEEQLERGRERMRVDRYNEHRAEEARRREKANEAAASDEDENSTDSGSGSSDEESDAEQAAPSEVAFTFVSIKGLKKKLGKKPKAVKKLEAEHHRLMRRRSDLVEAMIDLEAQKLVQMTYEEQADLCAELLDLNYTRMRAIVDIMAKGMNRDDLLNEVKIDMPIECIDNATLREIQMYLENPDICFARDSVHNIDMDLKEIETKLVAKQYVQKEPTGSLEKQVDGNKSDPSNPSNIPESPLLQNDETELRHDIEQTGMEISRPLF